MAELPDLDRLDAPPEDESAETKGERTRRRLLQLAIERFGERGFRATSVSVVARAAGLTQAAVYAYFDGKEALFDAAVDADAEGVVTKVRSQMEGGDPRALIASFLMFTLACLDEHPLAKRVLMGEEREALSRLLNLPALAHFTDWMAEELRAGQAAGTVRADIDAQIIADGSESLVLGLLMAVTQVGATTEQRRQLGVLGVFDAALRPPE
jgi:AcrR family transcriptional regulator